jgi:hypothetical protein
VNYFSLEISSTVLGFLNFFDVTQLCFESFSNPFGQTHHQAKAVRYRVTRPPGSEMVKPASKIFSNNQTNQGLPHGKFFFFK